MLLIAIIKAESSKGLKEVIITLRKEVQGLKDEGENYKFA